MPLIHGTPQLLAGQRAREMYNLPRSPEMQPYQPEPQQPGLMDLLGASLGQGLGEGIQKSIYEQMEQSALQKALGTLKPGMSATEQLQAIAAAPSSAREFLGKYGIPLIQSEQAQQQKAMQQSALANILGSAAGIPQQVSPSQGIEKEISGMSEQQLGQLLPLLNPQEQKMVLDTYQRQQKMRQQEEALGLREQQFRYGETKEFRKDVLEGLKDYNRKKATLTRLEQLVDKGTLTTPATASLLNKLGIPLGILSNPDSEEFDKLSQDLTAGITADYGNRILQAEFQNFLRRIPTLMNSDQGKKRVIENLKAIYQPKELYYKAYKDIIKENKGKVPLDIEERVVERVEPELDALASRFNKNIQPTITMSRGGTLYSIPVDRVEEALQQGFTRE